MYVLKIIEFVHCSNQGRDCLPGIEGLAGTVELVSMSTMPRYKTQSSPRPGGGWTKSPVGTAWANTSTLDDGNAQEFNSSKIILKIIKILNCKKITCVMLRSGPENSA